MTMLKSIFRKSKKTYTPEAQADILLSSARIMAKHEIENHKDLLTRMGFIIFDTSTLIELTIFYYSLKMGAVDNSPIPSAVKEKIKDAMVKSYLLWIQSCIKDKNVINDFMKWMKGSLEIYQGVHKMTEERVRNNQDMTSVMTDVAKALIVVWRRYLKENLDLEKNIFDGLPLATFYFESVMALSPIFTDEICKMNLSEEEYQKRKEFLELIKRKSGTEEGRRNIEKG